MLSRLRAVFKRRSPRRSPSKSPRRSPSKSPRRSPNRSPSVYYNAARSLNNMIRMGYITMPRQPPIPAWARSTAQRARAGMRR